MEDKKHIAPDLLAKYFAGACSTDEVREVETWKAANEDAYLAYYTVWQDTGLLSRNPEHIVVDTEKAWQKVRAKTVDKTNSASWTVYVWRVAAIAIVAFSLGYWLAGDRMESQLASTFSVNDGKGTIMLADSSEVTLNQASTLAYASDFGDGSRTVTLTGEAFFEVTRNPEVPFRVIAGSTQIEVLGTAFNVKMTNGSVEVSVTSGVVSVTNSGQEVMLKANERAYFDSTSQKLTQLGNDFTGQSTFWKNHRLAFENQKLREVASTLEKAYGVQILLQGNQLDNCQLHVTFDNSTVDEVMEIIALTLELKIEKQGTSYLLSGKGCGN